ncbi:MAG: hypothetical protein HY537_11960 [Deltaproteobacteria bacterium]|nr:hypothetical protein [Deltaproteobacteria bacterium]
MKNPVNLLIIVAGVGLITGCGRTVNTFVNNFSCSQANFHTIKRLMVEYRTGSVENPLDQHETYRVVALMNQKLGSQCPTQVLDSCSPGNTRISESSDGEPLSGPIQSFGIQASRKVEILRRMGALELKQEIAFPQPPLTKTSVSLSFLEWKTKSDWKTFDTTLACYLKNAGK